MLAGVTAMINAEKKQKATAQRKALSADLANTRPRRHKRFLGCWFGLDPSLLVEW
jgi:hypothetical protein